MDKRLRTALTELRCRFETLYGERLVRMVLFGSQARGDAEPGSDIDVLVVLKEPVEPYEEIKRSSDIVGELSLDWDVVISCVFVDENQFFQRDGPFLRNVRREGVAV